MSKTRLFFALFIAATRLVAGGFSDRTQQLADSALDLLSMTRSDCAMHADYVTSDHQRLSLVNKLFVKPMNAGNIASDYSALFHTTHFENGDLVYKRLMADAQLGFYSPPDLSKQESLDSVILAVHTPDGKPLPKSIVQNFTLSMLMRQYVYPVLAAAQGMRSSQLACMKHSVVLRECDSLLMMSEDDASASPYQMHSAERASDSLSRLYFEEAAACDVQRLCSTSLSTFSELLSHAQQSLIARSILIDSVTSIVIETMYGPVCIGGPGDDTYDRDYLLIVDVGGNDRYIMKQTKEGLLTRALRAIVDLAGNDVYVGSSYTFGSAIFGGSMLIDMAGNDSYRAGSFSLGAGLFGVGILYDASGTDSYSGEVFSEGAGAFGIGLLLDDKGNDLYSVQAYGQGFGYCGGVGIVSDNAGNDVYTTQSPFVDVLRYDAHFVSFTQGAALGQRPIASGGIGMLLDKAGNDTYTCDIFGQGSAYWFGFAALVDEDGEDRYQAYQYAQGAGIHFAHGLLWDKKGDDVYVSHGVSQGCGHDVGAGILVDERGNDSYVTESLSLGGGNANAVSFFIDEEGDDSYIARSPASCFGYSDFRRSYGMIGAFVDGGGNDHYGETTQNNTLRTKSYYGAFLDLQSQPSAVAKAVEEKDTSARYPLSGQMDSLFVQASTAPQKYQYMVNPARDRLVEMGDSALRFCAGHFGDPYPRERLALEYMLPKFCQKDSANVSALLADSLHSKNLTCLNFCLWSVGKCKLKALSAQVEALCSHPDWRVRSNAAEQIGEAEMVESLAACRRLLNDSVDLVRMRAIYTLARLAPDDISKEVKIALKDPSQLVRNAVGMGLRAHNNLAFSVLQQLLRRNTTPSAHHALALAFPAVDTISNASDVADQILSFSADERRWTYSMIQDLHADFWNQLKTYCASKETDSVARTLLGITESTPQVQRAASHKKRKSTSPH